MHGSGRKMTKNKYDRLNRLEWAKTCEGTRRGWELKDECVILRENWNPWKSGEVDEGVECSFTN